jgi:GNAT superfamily N-acetyltransferase
VPTAPDATSTGSRHTVRRVRPADVDAVVALVHELADYERAPEECTLTAAQLHTALFDDDPAVFGHVAVVGGEVVGGEVVGIALWFLTFSTWDGVHGIHLEDLYVSPAHRRGGVGLALLAELAAECTRRGFSRLEWSVLDWNSPALDFYAAIGAVGLDGWTVHRLTGDPLAALASRRP